MARTPAKRPTAATLQPEVALRLLRSAAERGRPLGTNANLQHDEFAAWHSQVQHILVQTFGDPNAIVETWQSLKNYAGAFAFYAPPGEIDSNRRRAMGQALKMLESNLELLEAQSEPEQHSPPRKAGNMTFIGHGRSPAWRDLRDFLKDRLHLPVDEFNRMPPAGMTTVERLEEMLDSARFAFLVMTAEDEDSEGKVRARQNVVHEVGLFQGRLGFKKAIMLFEEGCEEFSNITGLTQIRFPPNDISAKFEEIRRVLEREGLLPGTGAAF